MSAETSRLMSEEWAVVGTIDADAAATGTYTSDVVDMSDWDAVLAVVQAGTIAAGGTVDFKLQSAPATGSGWEDITGKAITQLTQAGSDSDKQVLINLRGGEVKDQGDRYVRGILEVGTAAADSAVLIMARGKHKPASDNDLASVDEIVS